MLSFTLVLLISTALYSLMHFLESISIMSNIAGKITGNTAQGKSLQHAIFVLGRIFLPVLLIILSFAIESDIKIKDFLLISTSLCIFAFLSTLFALIYTNFFQIFFQKVIFFHEKYDLPLSIAKALFNKDKISLENFDFDFKLSDINLPQMIKSTLGYFLLSVAFLVSFSFAILYSEYRLTISQLTTILQGLGGLIIVFYVDPLFSKKLDERIESETWKHNFYSIMIGRLMAFFISSITFVVAFYS